MMNGTSHRASEPFGRERGKIYLECFAPQLLSPVLALDPSRYGIGALGASIWRDASGRHHVLERVSTTNYPTPGDFMLECEAFGSVSRKIQSNFPWSKLEAGSRLILLHDRARGNTGDSATRCGAFMSARIDRIVIAPSGRPQRALEAILAQTGIEVYSP